MNRATKYTINLFFLLMTSMLLVIVLLTGCTLDGISDEPVDAGVTPADLEAASQILGESLADESSGVMASLNDALSPVSQTGLAKSKMVSDPGLPTTQTHDDDSKSGRGEERNYSYNYSSATGIHTIAFQRLVHSTDYYKSVNDTLKYIFTDNNGNYIAFPRENEERIETIDFKGQREGEIETALRSSFFVRKDTFFIDGVSESSPVLAIDGNHFGTGNLTATNDAGETFQRSYENKIHFLNIQISKEIARESGSLEHGVTGTLSWEMLIIESSGGSSETKTVTGTIEMNGDGTALMRFEGFEKLFLINLDDGHVRDHDDEFEGMVSNVHIENNSFTLLSGRTITLSESVQYDSDTDLNSLESVARSLEAGNEVKAEGVGSMVEELFIASKVSFRQRIVDEHHFEGRVSAVNLDTRIVTFGEEYKVRFDEESVISENSQMHTLEAVKDTLAAGHHVWIAGYGIIDSDSHAEVLVIEAKFRYEEQSTESFEGVVTGVNLEGGSLTFHDETMIYLHDRTDIFETGNLYTLAEVAEALEAGFEVIAYGHGRVMSDHKGIAADKIVIRAKPEDFETGVNSVNLDAGTFTLSNGHVIRIGDITVISENSDYLTLQAVAEALQQEVHVIAIGHGKYDRFSDARLVAVEVRFRQDL